MLSFLIDCISKHHSSTEKALDVLTKKIQISDVDVVDLWKKSFSKVKKLKKPSFKTSRTNSFPSHSRSPQQLLTKLDKYDDTIWEISKNLADVVKDLKDCKIK